MDNRTYQALLESIKHWEDNLNARYVSEISTRRQDCALCNIFHEDDCNGCPVKEATGTWCCLDTPYYKVADFKNWHKDSNLVSLQMRKAIEQELTFLQSLLPTNQGETK